MAVSLSKCPYVDETCLEYNISVKNCCCYNTHYDSGLLHVKFVYSQPSSSKSVSVFSCIQYNFNKLMKFCLLCQYYSSPKCQFQTNSSIYTYRTATANLVYVNLVMTDQLSKEIRPCVYGI